MSSVAGDALSPTGDTQTPSPAGWRAIPTTCIETINGDPETALRLSFQIKVF